MYFIANWKMFGSLKTIKSINKVVSLTKKLKKNKIRVIYCPPTNLIFPLVKKLKLSSIEVGGQNCHESENYGAYTGQINSKMLKDVGAKYVILGHSENRQLGESDQLINKKIQSSIKSKLKVIFCVGETLKQRKNNKTNKILLKQIKIGLKNIRKRKNIMIAYEPVWAIGSGLTPKNSELLETVGFIKSKIKGCKVLYGGSVNSNNIKDLKKIYNVDGFLIGGASQISKKFVDIIKKTVN